MGWYDDFGAGTYQTSSGNINFGLQIFYDRNFLTRAKEHCALVQFGQKRPLPKGRGKQIRFFRWNEIALASGLSLLTEGVNPNATVVSGQEVNATIAEYGAFSQHSSLISATHVDRNLASLSGLWGDHAGRTIDMLTWEEVAKYGCFPMRVDAMTNNAAASYSIHDVSVVTSTNNTSVAVICGSATVGTTADWWNGGLLCVTEGTNEGQTRYVHDYASSGTWATVTVSPGFEAACDSTSKFRLVQTTALAAGDIPTYATLREMRARLKNNLAMPYAGGYYVFICDPDVAADLMSDSTWTGVNEYRNTPEGGIFKGELGKFHGFRFVEATQVYRHSEGTVQTRSDTARTYLNLALGKEAFGVTTFPGRSKPKIIVKNPGPQDTSNPLNRYSTIGWELPFVPKALNSKWAIGLFTYH